FGIFLECQLAAYGLGLLAMAPATSKGRLSGAAASFMVLNAAAWCAFWVWALGRTGTAWRKTEYHPLTDRPSRILSPVAAPLGPSKMTADTSIALDSPVHA